MRSLEQYYGDLRADPEARARFIRDARAMLHDVGEALAREGLIGENWQVKRASGSGQYAGEVFGLYPARSGRHGVLVALVHKPNERLTRLDGITGYVQRRKMKDMHRFEIRSSVLKRIILHSFAPWGILSQVRAMLQEEREASSGKARKRVSKKASTTAKKKAAKKKAVRKVARKKAPARKKVARK